jgi:DNA-directed RNA polymerase specialized sigma subunit
MNDPGDSAPLEEQTNAFPKLSVEEANALVVENSGWAESIARSVARAWNLDWRDDGLDGAAMEALLFCARRFQPARGVPFRGYARKRIHEASTEAARKSKGWRKSSDSNNEQHQARELSAELLQIFPDLRTGELPLGDEPSGDDGEDIRGAVRNLLFGATMLAAKEGISTAGPDDIMDYKKMVRILAELDEVHQSLLWEVYWEGNSMRTVASEWEVDELSVIREHKSLIIYLQKGFAKTKAMPKLKVRPALKEMNLKMRKKGGSPPFSLILERGAP